MSLRFQILVAAFCSLSFPSLLSALTNQTSEAPSGGGWSSNAGYRVYSSIGQGVLAGASRASGFTAFSGSANTFVLNPSADHNQNGIPDENDPDDDSDGLPDLLELSGLLFSPPTETDPLWADSDLDDVSDRDEAAAGTNPRDDSSLLQLLALNRLLPDRQTIIWRAREGRTYELLAAASPLLLRNNPEIAGEYVGGFGSGDWKETLLVVTNLAPGEAGRFWAVRLKP